jgi:hypothetical protein
MGPLRQGMARSPPWKLGSNSKESELERRVLVVEIVLCRDAVLGDCSVIASAELVCYGIALS